MACFLVPAAEAAVTTVATKIIEAKEKEAETTNIQNQSNGLTVDGLGKISFSNKMKWLNKLLWGGSVLLAFEHVWHGEVVPWFPFLTAASNPADTMEMLREMSTVGVSMAALVTAVWVGMVSVVSFLESRTFQKSETKVYAGRGK